MTNLRLRYQTIEFVNNDIHLCTLRDRQQFADPQGMAEKLGISSAFWPLFGVVWPSSLVLAHFMDSYNTNAKRILEVGCGIALPSLLLNAKREDITATDHHPEVQTFLNRNTILNNDSNIAFERTDWNDAADQLGLFDIIIGSDLLYEDQHIKQLANFIQAHANPTSEVILVDPGRGRKRKLATTLATFGYHMEYQTLPPNQEANTDFKGHILKFNR